MRTGAQGAQTRQRSVQVFAREGGAGVRMRATLRTQESVTRRVPQPPPLHTDAQCTHTCSTEVMALDTPREEGKGE